jgi:hypothetical protein
MKDSTRRRRAQERALLDLAGAIVAFLQKMDGAAPPRDRRAALRFVGTLPRATGSRDGARHTRAAWQAMPAHLQHRIAALATAAGCADELHNIIDQTGG